jgi:hypothetical protein
MKTKGKQNIIRGERISKKNRRTLVRFLLLGRRVLVPSLDNKIINIHRTHGEDRALQLDVVWLPAAVGRLRGGKAEKVRRLRGWWVVAFLDTRGG